jgi:hypothetical protein
MSRKIKEEDISFPTYVYICHAVCRISPNGCGWAGFLLEGAFEVDGKAHNSGTGDRVLPAITNQTCPSCGETVFRAFGRRYYANSEALGSI